MDAESLLDPVRAQVLTSRNVKGHPVTDWFYKRATDDPLLRKILVLSQPRLVFSGYGRLMVARSTKAARPAGATQAPATFTREGDHSPSIG